MKNPPNEIDVTLAITINGVTATQTLAGRVPILSKGHATFTVDKAESEPESRLLEKLLINTLLVYGRARFGEDLERYETWLLSKNLSREIIQQICSPSTASTSMATSENSGSPTS